MAEEDSDKVQEPANAGAHDRPLVEVSNLSGLEDDDGVAFLADGKMAFPFDYERACVALGKFLRLFDGARFVVDDGLPDLDRLPAVV